MCQTIPQKKDICFHLLYVTELVMLADAFMVQRRKTTISSDRRTSIFSYIKLTIVQNDHYPSARTIFSFSKDNLLPSGQMHYNTWCCQQIPWFTAISRDSSASGYIKLLVAKLRLINVNILYDFFAQNDSYNILQFRTTPCTRLELKYFQRKSETR
jgi:hypothetical protein